MYRTSNEALKSMTETQDPILADLARELLAARAVVEAVPSLLQSYEDGVEIIVDECGADEDDEEMARAVVTEMDALLYAHEKSAGNALVKGTIE